MTTSLFSQYSRIWKSLIPVLIITMFASFHALSAAAQTVSTDVPLTLAASTEARSEVLWLARAVYSESKVKEEQLIIAWVVRNRLESGNYGSTYKEVVLQRGQFSGLNPGDKQYTLNMTRTYQSQGDAWKNAIAVATAVYYANDTLRPIGKQVTHFYSPRSVAVAPSWATGVRATHVIQDPESHGVRFAFYSDIK